MIQGPEQFNKGVERGDAAAVERSVIGQLPVTEGVTGGVSYIGADTSGHNRVVHRTEVLPPTARETVSSVAHRTVALPTHDKHTEVQVEAPGAPEQLNPVEVKQRRMMQRVTGPLEDPESIGLLLESPDSEDQVTQRRRLINQMKISWQQLSHPNKIAVMTPFLRGQLDPQLLPNVPRVAEAALVVLSELPLKGSVREEAVGIYAGLTAELSDNPDTLRTLEATGQVLMKSVSQRTEVKEGAELRHAKSYLRVLQAADAARGISWPKYEEDTTEPTSIEDARAVLDAYARALADRGARAERPLQGEHASHVVARMNVIKTLLPGRRTGELVEILNRYESISHNTVGDHIKELRESQEADTSKTLEVRRQLVGRLMRAGMRQGIIAEITGIGINAVAADIQWVRKQEEMGKTSQQKNSEEQMPLPGRTVFEVSTGSRPTRLPLEATVIDVIEAMTPPKNK